MENMQVMNSRLKIRFVKFYITPLGFTEIRFVKYHSFRFT